MDSCTSWQESASLGWREKLGVSLFMSTEDAEHQGYCVLRAHAASSLDGSGRAGRSWLASGAMFPAPKHPESKSKHSVQKVCMRGGGVAGCRSVKVTHPLQWKA